MKPQLVMALSGVLVGAALALLSSGCGGAEKPAGAPDAAVLAQVDAAVTDGGQTPSRSPDEARILHPRLIDLHTHVIKRSCSPNPGVCHNDGNYPDLRTPAALLAAVEAPCNVDIPEPTQGWDACEKKADVMVFDDGFRTPIAWVEHIGPGRWRFGVKDPLRFDDEVRVAFHGPFGETILEPLAEWLVLGQRRIGATQIDVAVGTMDGFVAEIIDASLATVAGGDPNKNGTWGGDRPSDGGRLVQPGSLARSYLWGRLTATVPGSRMPLANQPLSNADYVALACWIEQMERAPMRTVGELIDYDRCDYAKDPTDPALP